MRPFTLLLLTALGSALTPAADSAPGRPPLQAGQAWLMLSTNHLSVAVRENYTATTNFLIWNGDPPPQGKMLYIISRDVSWLSLSAASGSVSNESNTISAVFSAGTLPTGTNTGTITIDAFDALTGQRAGGAPKTIALTMVVTRRVPLNFAKPVVQGIPYVGQTLNAWRGLWQSANSLVFDYEWQMANDKYGRGLVSIQDASGALITSTNYTVGTNACRKYLRIKVTATDPYPAPLSTTVYSDFTAAKLVIAAPKDFCGDGLTDLWLFDPNSATWRVAFFINREASLVFGNSDCQAMPADYDGDGKVDPAVFETSSGLWAARLSASGYAAASVLFGGPGYTPLSADFDGDGKTDPTLYEPLAGSWSALLSGNSYLPAACSLGGAGCSPVPGDYDGDGKTDPAVYEWATGLWLVLLSGGNYALAALAFGGPDYTPAPGDYDGDGRTDAAVYWPAGNRWWLRSSQTGAVRQESFGTSAGNSIPVPGYFDHDAKCDPATVYIAGDFMIWGILCSNTNVGYRGQSFQFSVNSWRVSWEAASPAP